MVCGMLPEGSLVDTEWGVAYFEFQQEFQGQFTKRTVYYDKF
jgi:hypothetical protein